MNNAEIVAKHIRRLIEEKEPMREVAVQAAGSLTVELVCVEDLRVYRRVYGTIGYTSLDRDAPEKILAAFLGSVAHVFSQYGPGRPAKKEEA